MSNEFIFFLCFAIWGFFLLIFFSSVLDKSKEDFHLYSLNVSKNTRFFDYYFLRKDKKIPVDVLLVYLGINYDIFKELVDIGGSDSDIINRLLIKSWFVLYCG